MQEMRFEAPETLDAAVALLTNVEGEARVLAGGTDLLVQLRAEVIEPALVVDIKRIPEMLAITQIQDGGFKIGAAVPCQTLGEDVALKAAWPGVVEGAELIGSTQIQGRASMGGNLCNASPAADSVPGMVAAGATVRIIGPDGEREIPVQELPAGPGKTTLAKGEVVAYINLPAPALSHTFRCARAWWWAWQGRTARSREHICIARQPSGVAVRALQLVRLQRRARRGHAVAVRDRDELHGDAPRLIARAPHELQLQLVDRRSERAAHLH